MRYGITFASPAAPGAAAAGSAAPCMPCCCGHCSGAAVACVTGLRSPASLTAACTMPEHRAILALCCGALAMRLRQANCGAATGDGHAPTCFCRECGTEGMTIWRPAAAPDAAVCMFAAAKTPRSAARDQSICNTYFCRATLRTPVFEAVVCAVPRRSTECHDCNAKWL